ncbi:MAG: CCA tRNA nucleotidyltransferase [Firmicutes bacterium]|nr:CCA tRNA nucleotidyltransferase [Bacillota bacterium]
MKINLPSHVQFIINTLESAGHEAFIVGGCVRDVLRGVTPKDWDVATSATPQQAKVLFVRTVDTGIKHGTITVLLDGQHYEVTTYRIDGEYLDSRRPETVEFVSSIEEDLSRRDFTMNAIAYNPNKGFVDPFDGQNDIKNELIRCVGDPVHRFTEDALRMLRAIRFSGTTGFAICPALLEAINKLKHNLANVSPERIREELTKLIMSPHTEAMSFLESTGLMRFVLQGRDYDGTYFELLKKCPFNEPMRMALFIEWTRKDCQKLLRDLRFDNKSIKEISTYVDRLHNSMKCDRYEIKKILRDVPQGVFNNLLTLKTVVYPGKAQLLASIRREAADIYNKGECFTLRDLAINGSDLAALGIPRGKGMGSILEALLDMVMRTPGLNTKDVLVKKLPELCPEIFPNININ